MAKQLLTLPAATVGLMTTFVFCVRNVPAALYKALGDFVTNGIKMTRLESYMVGGAFTATLFLCEVVGHPEHPVVRWRSLASSPAKPTSSASTPWPCTRRQRC